VRSQKYFQIEANLKKPGNLIVEIFISEGGEKELQRLELNIHEVVAKLVGHVPDRDLIHLSHILVTDIPEKKWTRLKGALGAYCKKWSKQPARIEIYLKNIFGNANLFYIKHCFALAECKLAHVLYHEIGHHVEKTRSHGITKKTKELHADKYASKLLPLLILENADSIRKCLQFLETNRDQFKINEDEIHKMKADWENAYQKVLKSQEASLHPGN
jgi:hypothetical protein